MAATVTCPVPPICALVVQQRIQLDVNMNQRGGHSGAMVTHSSPTSEVGGSNPDLMWGKLVVAYQWSTVYSTEPSPTVFTVYVSSPHKTTRRDMTCTVLKVM